MIGWWSILSLQYAVVDAYINSTNKKQGAYLCGMLPFFCVYTVISLIPMVLSW